MLRGGSWINNPVHCRSAYRNNNHPANANNNIGFRVCCLPRAPFIARSAGRDSRG
ncbi:MAG: SUMF1/EgtB/PvdO family nonheme iron enzyme [Cyanobacteriota bacterium]